MKGVLVVSCLVWHFMSCYSVLITSSGPGAWIPVKYHHRLVSRSMHMQPLFCRGFIASPYRTSSPGAASEYTGLSLAGDGVRHSAKRHHYLASTLDGDRQYGIREDEHYGNYVCPGVDP